MMSPRLPDQSTDLAPVLASYRGDERICVPKPSSEGERVGGGGSSPLEKEAIIVGAIGREKKVSELVSGLVMVVLVVGRSVGVRGS